MYKLTANDTRRKNRIDILDQVRHKEYNGMNREKKIVVEKEVTWNTDSMVTILTYFLFII